MEENKFLIVEAKTLPDVFLKVVHAKKLLARGVAKNHSEAARLAEVSRSAFYKYKDSVFAYEQNEAKRMLSLSVTLNDEPGMLSNMLTRFYNFGANIITVNQNIPVDGVAAVSVSISVNRDKFELDELLSYIKELEGVVDIKSIASR